MLVFKAPAISAHNRYRKTIGSQAPMCEVTEKGRMVYSEAARPQSYLDEMSGAGGVCLYRRVVCESCL